MTPEQIQQAKELLKKHSKSNIQQLLTLYTSLTGESISGCLCSSATRRKVVDTFITRFNKELNE